MATPTYIKCSGHIFELVEFEPINSNYKMNSIQCTNCGGVAGISEYYASGVLINRLSEAVKRIAERLGVLVDL
jgi:hypothetical protein